MIGTGVCGRIRQPVEVFSDNRNVLKESCFFTLPTTFAVVKAVQLIKAGSSAWIHQAFPNLRNFAWQQGYGAFSVGMSQVQSSSNSNIIGREPFNKSI
jgi:hypothetical protein